MVVSDLGVCDAQDTSRFVLPILRPSRRGATLPRLTGLTRRSRAAAPLGLVFGYERSAFDHQFAWHSWASQAGKGISLGRRSDLLGQWGPR